MRIKGYTEDKKFAERIKVNAKRYRSRNLTFIREYKKKHPCIDCNFSDYRALDFDHVRGEKLGNVSWMASRGFSLEKIELEIAKCEIRCRNCHAVKTWDEIWGGSLSGQNVGP